MLMHLTMKIAALAAAAVLGSCTAPSGPVVLPSQPSTVPAGPLLNLGASIEARLLRAHNREREAVGSLPLRWDPQLQQAAAAYARQLADTGQFQHASPESLRGQGENLWTGTRGAFTPEGMVADWASGRRVFQPGIFPNVSRTGNWADVGHYTQIIWRETHSVGCAVASSAQHDYLVCRYMVPGNVVGMKVP